MSDRCRVLIGDAIEQLRTLPSESVQCVVTSPPYWQLRDYGVEGQLGLEDTPEEYVAKLVAIFAEVRRVLRADGVCWVNLGDTYLGGRSGGTGGNSVVNGHNHQVAAGVSRWREANGKSRHIRAEGLRPKCLVGIPWRAALAMQKDDWWLRSDCVWSKPNPLPESVRDRPSRAHEYVFLFAKSERYFYDADAVRQPLAAKTATSWGTTRRSKGTDALGRVASHNFAADVPNRRPRVDAAGVPVGANLRTVWPIDDGAVLAKARAALWRALSSGWAPEPGHESELVASSLGLDAVPDVWTIASQPYDGAHFATMPPRLAERCILAGSRPGDVVLDPFAGSGTTLEVALRHGRHALGIELSPEYAKLIEERIRAQLPRVAEGA